MLNMFESKQIKLLFVIAINFGVNSPSVSLPNNESFSLLGIAWYEWQFYNKQDHKVIFFVIVFLHQRWQGFLVY